MPKFKKFDVVKVVKPPMTHWQYAPDGDIEWFASHDNNVGKTGVIVKTHRESYKGKMTEKYSIDGVGSWYPEECLELVDKKKTYGNQQER